MQTQTFRLGTYNIGANASDFDTMTFAYPEERNKLQEIIVPRAEKIHNNNPARKAPYNIALDEYHAPIETAAANRIAQQLDVICLQEFEREDRPFSQELQRQGFSIYYDPNKKDTAVAVKNGLFKNVKPVSLQTANDSRTYYGQDIAAVNLTFNGSNITVSSLHSWGFLLFQPGRVNSDDYVRADRENMSKADEYVQRVIDHSSKQPTTHKIFAGDMNNNPGNYQNTFDKITRAGFDTLSAGVPTSVNGIVATDVNSGLVEADNAYIEREIDFIFSPTPKKKTFLQKIASLFFSSTSLVAQQVRALDEFEFKVEGGSSSDHKPVATIITVTKTDSLIKQLFKSLINKFR